MPEKAPFLARTIAIAAAATTTTEAITIPAIAPPLSPLPSFLWKVTLFSPPVSAPSVVSGVVIEPVLRLTSHSKVLVLS